MIALILEVRAIVWGLYCEKHYLKLVVFGIELIYVIIWSKHLKKAHKLAVAPYAGAWIETPD